MKNTKKATFREIVAKFYGKSNIEAIEGHKWGELRIMTENMATDGKTIITTDPENVDFSGFVARGGETEEMAKKVITPYFTRDYCTIPENLHGFIKNSGFKYFGFGIAGRWASIYSKLTDQERGWNNPDGMEFRDGAETLNAVNMQGRAVFGACTIAKAFKAFKVNWMGINTNSRENGETILKSCKMECVYKGTTFYIFAMCAAEFDEVEEIAGTAETLAMFWDGEDRAAGNIRAA